MSEIKKQAVIMQILPSLNMGGVERGTIDIAKAILKAELTPIVVSSGGNMTAYLREAKIKHIELPVNSKNPWLIYKNIEKIVNLIREYNVDIIHVRSRAPAWSAYYACQKTGCKLISTFHGSYSNRLFTKKPSFIKTIYNGIMLKADYVIAVSGFIKNYIKENFSIAAKISDQNLVVIHRGVDLNYFDENKVSQPRMIQLARNWNLPEDKAIIMLPARITSWKGHEFLIDALAKVKNDNFFCIIVGSDRDHKEYSHRLEKRIEKNNLEGKVQIVGETRDMPAAYLVCDIIISASVKPEAFGRIAIEAGAMSRTIIATNIGGSTETIIPGKTGFLVEPNDIDDLASKIDYVLSLSQSDRKEIGIAARKYIEQNFSNQKMCDETIALYQKILINTL
jgi:glycosyltransferase involved in cell wall biosynthesis